MTWLTKELMLQYMVWYLDMHTAKNLFDLAEVAVVAKAELAQSYIYHAKTVLPLSVFIGIFYN